MIPEDQKNMTKDPYLAHHFYMPGVWNPVLVISTLQICNYLDIYSKVCNNIKYLIKSPWIF